MKSDDQTARCEHRRSVTQEMHQVFAEWVKNLRFIKSDILKDPARKDLDEGSVVQPAAPSPANGASAGRSVDNA